MKIRSSQPSHRFDNFTTDTVLLTLMHHDRHPIFLIFFYEIFPISDRKKFKNLSLLRKFKILPSVFPPVCLDIYGSLDEVVTGL